MKKLRNTIKIIALVVISTLLTSCLNDWLTVNPKTDITRENLFSTQEGFKDALTGVYVQLKRGAGYGERLTFTTIEYLVSSWDVTTNTTGQRLGQFLYTDQGVENVMSGIFTQQYSVIASINAILDEIDAKRDVFTTEGLFELVKGECLALRAFIHFDLLRLYGPIPASIPSTPILPYVRTLSREVVPHSTYTEYQQAIMADITEATTLLSNADPIFDYSLEDLKDPGPTKIFNPADTYFSARHLRMNYFAVKALSARANLWFGNLPEAYEDAISVINAQNQDGSKKFRLGTASDMTAGNLALPVEHIFAIHEFSLFSKYNTFFAAGSLKKGTAETTVKSQLYGNTGTDIRETYLWELVTQDNQAKTYIIKKYNVPEATPQPKFDIRHIPLIRVSEMYLIAAEGAPALGQAQEYWNSFRIARNLPASTLPADFNQRSDEIIKEYRKEFFAEGQAFYNYKRVNAPKNKILWAPTAAAVVVNYVVPLPKTELINTTN